jgi:CheY-like chemotaxis protein
VRTEQANLSASSGSGLGLNICKQLTEALGGTMHLESEPNVGSTFTIYLPSDDVSEENDTTVTLSNKNETPGLQLTDTFDKKEKMDKTILVVDDSKMHNMAIKEFLSYSFSNCVISNSKNETYKTLNQSSIDCIILDHILFDTNSIEMARHIKNDRRHSSIPIIVYTGKMLSEDEIQKMNKFVNAIVSKKNGSYNKLMDTIYSCFHLTSPLSNSQSFGKVM